MESDSAERQQQQTVGERVEHREYIAEIRHVEQRVDRRRGKVERRIDEERLQRERNEDAGMHFRQRRQQQQKRARIEQDHDGGEESDESGPGKRNADRDRAEDRQRRDQHVQIRAKLQHVIERRTERRKHHDPHQRMRRDRDREPQKDCRARRAVQLQARQRDRMIEVALRPAVQPAVRAERKDRRRDEQKDVRRREHQRLVQVRHGIAHAAVDREGRKLYEIEPEQDEGRNQSLGAELAAHLLKESLMNDAVHLTAPPVSALRRTHSRAAPFRTRTPLRARGEGFRTAPDSSP